MLMIEAIILCSLFWGICYYGTGSDEKNIKSYASYPDEVQQLVKENPELQSKIKLAKAGIAFLSNLIVFVIVLFVFGFFVRETDFLSNFRNVLILGQTLNAFDFFVIDLLWWRNSARVRFTGTEGKPEWYRNPRKHFLSFLKGIVLFLLTAVIDGVLLSLF